MGQLMFLKRGPCERSWASVLTLAPPPVHGVKGCCKDSHWRGPLERSWASLLILVPHRHRMGSKAVAKLETTYPHPGAAPCPGSAAAAVAATGRSRGAMHP